MLKINLELEKISEDTTVNDIINLVSTHTPEYTYLLSKILSELNNRLINVSKEDVNKYEVIEEFNNSQDVNCNIGDILVALEVERNGDKFFALFKNETYICDVGSYTATTYCRKIW